MEAQKYKERSRASRDGELARRASEKLAEKAVLIRRTYAASHGEEHFLSFETPDEATIFGFVRLRLSANAAQQHSGFGRRLMADAERIAADADFRKVAVISGIGTRDYYRKLGYVLVEEGGFLVKNLGRPSFLWRLPLLYARVLFIAVEFFV